MFRARVWFLIPRVQNLLISARYGRFICRKGRPQTKGCSLRMVAGSARVE